MKQARLFQRLPYGTKSKNFGGTIVAYWNTEHREYVRARVEEPYKEMCSGRIKGYIFMVRDWTTVIQNLSDEST